MKSESDDLVITRMTERMFDAVRLTEMWKDEPREALERLRRKNAAFPQAEMALRGLLDEIDRREREAGQTEALGLMAGFCHRLDSIERKMPPPQKPEWRTWAFWMGFSGIVIGTLSWFRDYFDLQYSSKQIKSPDQAPIHVRSSPQIQSPPSETKKTSNK